MIPDDHGCHLGKTRHGRPWYSASSSLRFLSQGELVLSGGGSGQQAKVAVHMCLVAIPEHGSEIDEAPQWGTMNGGDGRLHPKDPKQQFGWQTDLRHDRALDVARAASSQLRQGIDSPHVTILLHGLERLVEGCWPDV